jgi:hypothetical protein
VSVAKIMSPQEPEEVSDYFLSASNPCRVITKGLQKLYAKLIAKLIVWIFRLE